ncbi:shikimate dehydrogenase [Flavobacterium coralii]|uniref:shikimate dehydrogenase family protein n=1 Tax=Flavobacterium coralii TaxID=2838017 RepID=UPI000C3CBA86|nr:shikimate dehydrogenase [Flavobacterium sp.]|tara:strand:+ start:63114 stop:63854 length:741 start_codon:yes stop_codon:yes gene_type:complete
MKEINYGLVGSDISYSFSPGYFKKKFEKDGLKNYRYNLYDISDINQLPAIIAETKRLRGLNVTIPYKEAIIPLLDSTSKTAKKIGAVNTVTVSKKGKLKGFNTDHYGFRKSLKPLLKEHHEKALILGTGGASKAVAYALRKLGIEYDFVSRNGDEVIFSYTDLDKEIFDEYHIIINTTPMGTYPNIEQCPALDYSLFTDKHIAFDLVYNPEVSTFLKKAGEQGAVTKNGYEMLFYQAEKAWEIWNK